MGLKKSYNTKYGINATNAYHKVKDIKGDSFGNIKYTVEVYLDENARKQGSEPVEVIRKLVPAEFISAIGVVHEVYRILKKEPEYYDAVDVFEPSLFPQLVNHNLKDSYIVEAFLSDGYSVVNNTITDAVLDGRIIQNSVVVQGIFTQVNATNITVDGYNLAQKGFITDGYANGYVVQKLGIL